MEKTFSMQIPPASSVDILMIAVSLVGTLFIMELIMCHVPRVEKELLKAVGENGLAHLSNALGAEVFKCPIDKI